MLTDRMDKDTQPCRLSGWLYRVEAGSTAGKVLDNRMDKAILSGREEAGFTNGSNANDTHHPRKWSF